jgi:hypothetical protein
VLLEIAFAVAALLLAVPVGLTLMLLALQAIGPGRQAVKGVRLPDLADDLL